MMSLSGRLVKSQSCHELVADKIDDAAALQVGGKKNGKWCLAGRACRACLACQEPDN